MVETIEHLNESLLFAIHEGLHGTITLDVLKIVQLAGVWQGIAVLLGLALLASPARRRFPVVARILVTILLAAALTEALKHAVDAPRPYKLYPERIHFELTEAKHTRSWPSGHATATFAFAGAVLALRARWWVSVLAFLVAGTTALARVAIGVHFPLDVLGGAVVGVGTALALRPPLEALEARWQARRAAPPIAAPLPGAPLPADPLPGLPTETPAS